MTDRPAPRWPIAVWAAGFLAIAAVVQFGFVSIPYDADTAYHVAVGRLIREHGILRAFPWTPFSWLADHYADKEELFHLLLAPLSGLDWIVASRIAGTVLGTVLLTVFWLLLRRERVRWAGLWVVAALASSGYFAVRFAIVRPHLLSIPLALAIAWAAARRRLALLFLLSLLYPLCYVGWHVALGLAVLAELARALSGERPSWKPAAAAAGGLALGVLIHPNFPAIVQLFWIQNARI